MGIAKQAKYCILFYDFTTGVRAPRGKRASIALTPSKNTTQIARLWRVLSARYQEFLNTKLARLCTHGLWAAQGRRRDPSWRILVGVVLRRSELVDLPNASARGHNEVRDSRRSHCTGELEGHKI